MHGHHWTPGLRRLGPRALREPLQDGQREWIKARQASQPGASWGQTKAARLGALSRFNRSWVSGAGLHHRTLACSHTEDSLRRREARDRQHGSPAGSHAAVLAILYTPRSASVNICRKDIAARGVNTKAFFPQMFPQPTDGPPTSICGPPESHVLTGSGVWPRSPF